MTAIRRVLGLAAVTATAVLVPATLAGAIQNPTTGQPGSNGGFTCSPGQAPSAGSLNSGGSVFNPNGVSGMHYAGNNNTPSKANANSTAAVSEYDVACLQTSTH